LTLAQARKEEWHDFFVPKSQQKSSKLLGNSRRESRGSNDEKKYPSMVVSGVCRDI
jgi:hypothetical protein